MLLDPLLVALLTAAVALNAVLALLWRRAAPAPVKPFYVPATPAPLPAARHPYRDAADQQAAPAPSVGSFTAAPVPFGRVEVQNVSGGSQAEPRAGVTNFSGIRAPLLLWECPRCGHGGAEFTVRICGGGGQPTVDVRGQLGGFVPEGPSECLLVGEPHHLHVTCGQCHAVVAYRAQGEDFLEVPQHGAAGRAVLE